MAALPFYMPVCDDDIEKLGSSKQRYIHVGHFVYTLLLSLRQICLI